MNRTTRYILLSASLLAWTSVGVSATALARGRAGIDAKARVAGGWDDNIYWALGLDPAHVPTSTSAHQSLPPVVADGLVGLHARLGTWYDPTWRHHLEFSWRTVFDEYIHQGWYQTHQGRLAYRCRTWRKLFVKAGVSAGGMWRQRYKAERFHFVTGRLGLAWIDLLRYRLVVEYRLKSLWFPDPDREVDGTSQVDLTHGPGVRVLGFALPWLSLQVGYAFLLTKSNKDFHDHTSHVARMGVTATLPARFKIDITALVQQDLLDRFHEPGVGKPSKRTDLFVQAQAGIRWQALGWLSIFGTYRMGIQRTTWNGDTTSIHRQTVLCGLEFTWSQQWNIASKGDKARLPAIVTAHPKAGHHSPPRTGQGTVSAARLSNQSIVFRLHAPKATHVSVIGSFHAWRPVAMHRQGSRWTATISLPPGRYQYRFLVDRRSVLPRRAQAYVPDGFGGTNAVLEVP